MRFLDALLGARSGKRNIVIPDIKCFSPKEGDLMNGRDPVEYARMLVHAGAPVLSVVTEEMEFHGSLSMLKEISDAVEVPILRKDFIHTREDLEETKAYGASAILLMCSCLEEEELTTLYYQALELGLDPFVETHVKEDFALVRKLGAKLVGINNRDITVLERDEGDVSNTESLAALAPEDAFLVTESSIKDPEQVRRAIVAGAHAALVGTAILKAEHTESFYRMMCRKISLKVCGLMNPEDVKLCVELGVERIGFVADYPLPVQWNLAAEDVKKLRALVPEGYKACIVVGGDGPKIREIARTIKPDMLQLHYQETMSLTAELAAELKEQGTTIIKSLPSSEEGLIRQFGTAAIEKIVPMINDSEVAEILIDPRHGSKVTSQNLTLDVELAKEVMALSQKPVVIAGGIVPANLEQYIEQTSCMNVDIMNGSEDAPGKKSREKIEKILEILDGIG